MKLSKYLKSRGLINNCGVGRCSTKEIKNWYGKWKNLNSKNCKDSIPMLRTTIGEIVFISDLLDIVTSSSLDQQSLIMYKFESAIICYENSNKCK